MLFTSKILFLAAFAALSCNVISAEESSEEIDLDFTDEASFIKALIHLGWDASKLTVLWSSIKEGIQDGQVAVIASQDIHNPDGSLKEINSLELIFPEVTGKKKKETNKEAKTEDEDDDDDDENEGTEDELTIKKLKEINANFNKLSAIGLPIQISYQEYSKKGQTNSEAYMNDKTLFVINEGETFLNHTLYLSSIDECHHFKKIEKEVNEHKADPNYPGLVPSILRYDVNGEFIESLSNPTPILITVTDITNGNYSVANTIVKAFLDVALVHPNEIPKNLVAQLDKLLPTFSWFVTRETESHHLRWDLCITLHHDLAVFQKDNLKTYMVFGDEH